MQMFSMIQLFIAALAGLCLLVTGVASVMYALNGTGPQEPVLERGGTTPEPLVCTRRSDRGSACRRSERPPLPVRVPGATFPEQC